MLLMAFLAEAFAFQLPEEGGARPFEFPNKGQPAFLSGWDSAADIRHCSGVHLSHQNLFSLSSLSPGLLAPMFSPSNVLSASLLSVTSPAALLTIFLCLPLTSHHLFLYYFFSFLNFLPTTTFPSSVFSLFAPLPPLPFSTLFFYHLCS